jgi:enediyne biosynthesis protein E4
VTGAVFSDLTGDGSPELVLAREWGSIAVFENHRGRFVDATERLGLSQYTGFWNGVTVGDFDGDGRLDIAASNWGRNTPYEQFLKDEWRVWFGQSGELVEAYVDRGRAVPAQDLNVSPVNWSRRTWIAVARSRRRI